MRYDGRNPMLRPRPSLEPLALGVGAGLELPRELAIEARITLVAPGRRPAARLRLYSRLAAG